MAILIDGFNLLHVTDVVAPTVGKNELSSLQQAFLVHLAELLSPREVAQTTVVFDAHGARAGKRRTETVHGFTVIYSSRNEDADRVLGDLILDCKVPKETVVVSSDRQIQRAARIRGAVPVDSDVWYADRRRTSREFAASKVDESEKPNAQNEADNAHWLAEFSKPEQRQVGRKEVPHSRARKKKRR